MKFLRKSAGVLEHMSSADVAQFLAIAGALLIGLLVLRWFVSFWRYTSPTAPRAPGMKHQRIS